MPVLGIDVGTSGSRALLLAEDGRLLGSTTADHAPFRSPQAAWAEQDPEDWWRASQQAVRALLASTGTSPERISAIGLSGQMHGAVLLDESGAVVRPAIIWCDQRTEQECRWLDREVGAERLLELTANPALTNFTLTKLLWVRTHEPALWSRVRHVLLPKDYVRYRLSGEFAIDVADASGTLMLDVVARAVVAGDDGRRPHRSCRPAEAVRVSRSVRAVCRTRAPPRQDCAPGLRSLPVRATRRQVRSGWALPGPAP